MEEYFDYKWENDRNQVLICNEYSTYLNQLPIHIVDELLNTYLFNGFLKVFDRFFQIPHIRAERLHARYTIYDVSYKSFLRDILKLLEPIKANKNQILFEELDEIDEIVFVCNSEIKIGYSINNKKFFRLTHQCNAVGAYGVTFNRKSHFIYKVVSDSEAYFIRQNNWSTMINSFDNKQLKQSIENKIKEEYEQKVESVLIIFKD